MRLRSIVWALVAAVVIAGCGGHAPRRAALVLDFAPNAVHAGIYSALARRYDRDEGIRLQVLVPPASTDSIKLLESGRTDFAILDIHDLAIARERGAPIVGIMAVVQRPLSAVIAAPGVGTPRQLEGRTVGITGVPSDTAVLRSIVAGAGGDPNRVKTITIGFNAVADLLAGRVSAATAFWNDEGVTLAIRRPGFHSFRVDDYGAPAYPELVLCATANTIAHDRSLALAVVRTVERGYAFTVSHPDQSTRDLERLVAGLDPKLVAAQLRALLPAFRAAGGAIGQLNVQRLQSWAAWEARFGIVTRPPNVAATFEPRLSNY
jgi:NitT/TauT family transport system substrate-binding protein/putative hydroxymethylpyrimidine transport system substrate-binding protein